MKAYRVAIVLFFLLLLAGGAMAGAVNHQKVALSQIVFLVE